MEIDITVFEYNSKDERVGSNSLNDIQYGESKVFKASSNAEKVKVYIKMSVGTVERYLWVQQVYYLKNNSNLDIKVTGTTMTGTKEP